MSYTKRRSSRNSPRTMMPRSRTLYNLLKEDWSDFKALANKRWSGIKGVDKKLLDSSLTNSKILGSGYFGIVLKTSNKKLVIKVTSDHDEGYFNQLILNDPELLYSKGLPYVLDCFHIPEWSAYVILRENVKFGLGSLPHSSPLARSIPHLDKFGEKTIKIESMVAKALDSISDVSGGITKADFNAMYREAQGLIRIEIIKTLKKLPKTSHNSKYNEAMFVIEHALDKYGIALWDLHSLNLGRHQYDMSEFNSDVDPLDKECVLILDVGGNFGSPVMSQMIENLEI